MTVFAPYNRSLLPRDPEELQDVMGGFIAVALTRLPVISAMACLPISAVRKAGGRQPER
jgi:hypothetical protein